MNRFRFIFFSRCIQCITCTHKTIAVPFDSIQMFRKTVLNWSRSGFIDINTYLSTIDWLYQHLNVDLHYIEWGNGNENNDGKMTKDDEFRNSEKKIIGTQNKKKPFHFTFYYFLILHKADVSIVSSFPIANYARWQLNFQFLTKQISVLLFVKSIALTVYQPNFQRTIA